jgi:hypothetical protein
VFTCRVAGAAGLQQCLTTSLLSCLLVVCPLCEEVLLSLLSELLALLIGAFTSTTADHVMQGCLSFRNVQLVCLLCIVGMSFVIRCEGSWNTIAPRSGTGRRRNVSRTGVR